MAFVTVYELRLDYQRIRWLQEATMTTRDFGLEPTHGLFGSPRWWRSIESGALPIHRATGVIVNTFTVGESEYPQFALFEQGGTTSTWTREVNRSEDDDLYTVGRLAEVDYVLQRSRADFAALGMDQTEKCVLKVKLSTPRYAKHYPGDNRSRGNRSVLRPEWV